MTTILKDFITNIPKAELHLHLEGTLEPDLKLKLALKNSIDIGQATIEEVQASYQFTDLTSFLNVYYPAMNVLQEEDDFYQLAMAYFRKAKENNIHYAEVFFDPQAHTSRGIAFDTLFNGYYRATQDAASLGVEAHLILCFLRDFSAESALEHYELCLLYRDKILGIGLDSDERDNPPGKFKAVFRRAKEDGFHITMHCDIDQVGSIENIREALLEIGVERLDHGTNIVEDPTLVDYVRNLEIGLTCCPVSNSFVVDDMKGSEIKTLLQQGVKVTINSDDPAYFQSYLSNDFYQIADRYNLSREEVIALVKNAFEIAWISPESKTKYLRQVDAYIQSVGA